MNVRNNILTYISPFVLSDGSKLQVRITDLHFVAAKNNRSLRNTDED